MVSGTHPQIGSEAVRNFRLAQNAGYDAFRQGRELSGLTCDPEAKLHIEWTGSPGVDITNMQPLQADSSYGRSVKAYGDDGFSELPMSFRERGVYVAHFKDVDISGNDGVIIDKACNMYLAAPGIYTDVAANVQMVTAWARDAPPRWHDWSQGRLPNHGATTPESVQIIEKAVVRKCWLNLFDHAIVAYSVCNGFVLPLPD